MKAYFARLLLKSSSLVTLMIAALACGLPQVRPAENQPIDEPGLPSASGFSLSESQLPKTFRGSLLIWKQETTRDDVAAILNSTRQYNLAFEESRRILNQIDQERLKPLEAQISEVKQDLDRLSMEVGDPVALRAVRLKASAEWFQNWTEAMAVNYGDSFDIQRAEDILSWYCDAKLWELAVQPWLAYGEFSQIPVAQPHCQNLFLSQGYFASPRCNARSVASAGSFDAFSCVWSALPKTRFVTIGPQATENVGAVLQALSENPEFRAIVAGTEPESSFCGLKNVHVKRMTGFRPLPHDSNCVVDPQGTIFEWGVLLKPVSPGAALAQLSAYDLGRLVEGQSVQLGRESTRLRYPRALLVFPDAGQSREGRPLSALERDNDSLAHRLGSLGERRAICGDRADRFAAADLFFTLPFVKSPEELRFSLEACTNVPVAGEFTELQSRDRDLEAQKEALRLEIERLVKVRRDALALFCDLSNGRAESGIRRAEMESRLRQTQEVETRALLASRDFAVTLVAEKSQRGENPTRVRVELSFVPGETAATGCFDLNSGRPVACSRSNSSEAALLVSADGKLGSLSFSLDLSQMSPTSSALANFPVDLRSSLMSATVYQSALGQGTIPFISGRVRFESSAGTLALGEASYLFEVDSNYEKANKLVSECSRIVGG